MQKTPDGKSFLLNDFNADMLQIRKQRHLKPGVKQTGRQEITGSPEHPIPQNAFSYAYWL